MVRGAQNTHSLAQGWQSVSVLLEAPTLLGKCWSPSLLLCVLNDALVMMPTTVVVVMASVETVHGHLHKNVLSFSHQETWAHIGAGAAEDAPAPCSPLSLHPRVLCRGRCGH